MVTQAASKGVLRALTAAQRVVPRFDSKETKSPSNQKNVVSLNGPEQIQKALKKLQHQLTTTRNVGYNKIRNQVEDCESGNIVTLIDDNKTVENQLDDSISIQFNNCIKTENAQSVLRTGHISAAAGITTETNVLTRKSNPLTGSFTQDVRNGTTRYQTSKEEVYYCDGKTFYKKIGILSNVKVDFEEDKTGNGTLDFNIQYELSNWDLQVREDLEDENDCKQMKAHFVLNGGVSETNFINSEFDFSVGFQNFEMKLASETIPRAGFAGASRGIRVHFSGSAAINGPCSLGRFTIQTPSDDALFFPTNSSCPNKGRFIISTTAGEHAVIAGPGGTIQIDLNNDDSIDENYPNCDSAKLCNELR